MRKQLLLLKTLLVAVLLGVGVGNAWGQTATWAMNSAGTYTGGMELSSNTAVASVKLGNGTWGYDSDYGVCETGVGKDKTPTKTDGIPTAGNFIVIVPTVDVVMTLDTRSSANHNFYLVESTAPTTYIIDVRARYYQTYNLGTISSPLKAGKTYYAYSAGGATLGYRAFTVKSVEPYTIHYKDDSATPVTIKSDVVRSGLYGTTVTATEDDMASINYNNKTYSYKSGNKNLTLSTETNEITLVFETATVSNYKIKYQDDSTTPVTIKDDVEVESYVGASVTATGENFPTDITYNTVRYKYASGNNALEVTGNAATDVITLTYTPCSTFSYTVNGYDGSDNKITPTSIAFGSYLEGDDAITKYYPRYVLSGNKLYCSGTGSVSYKTTFTPNANNYDEKVTYNTGDPIANVVFYMEGEDVTDASEASNGDRASMGKMGYTGGTDTYKDVVTLAPGKYKISTRFQNGSGSNTYTFNFKIGGEIVHTGNCAKGTNQDATSNEFTVSTSSTLSFASNGNTNAGMDYFYVVQTAVAAPISEFGKSTFSSTYALDFTDITEATAYIATAQNGDNITMKAITGTVAANTGLVLKSANGGATSFNIPIATSGTVYNTESETKNYLFAINSNYYLNKSNNGTNYVLSVQEINQVETVVWAPIGATAAPVKAGQAALWIPTGGTSASRSLRMVFGDNSVTGIGDATRLKDKGQMINDKVVFNLNGQRVKKAAKGLYIVNGKKYIK